MIIERRVYQPKSTDYMTAKTMNIRSFQQVLLESVRTRARSAVQQIEVAFVTMRDGGNTLAAAYYEAQLPKVPVLFDLLTSR